jgi:hypothetical protein
MSAETQTSVPTEAPATNAAPAEASSPPSATSSEPSTVNLDIVYESLRIERHCVESELCELLTKRRDVLTECFLRFQKVFGADISRLRDRRSRLNGALAELDKIKVNDKEPVNDAKPTVESEQSGVKTSLVRELIAILDRQFPTPDQ